MSVCARCDSKLTEAERVCYGGTYCENCWGNASVTGTAITVTDVDRKVIHEETDNDRWMRIVRGLRRDGSHRE